ncbi:MAG: hypothetical protein ACPK85_04390 [Methanosarcina sp.]
MDKERQTDNSQYITMPIGFTPDESGKIGRECPECEKYFKVKFGTGLPITYQICPYCGYKEDSNNFFTQDQIKYMHSVIANEVLAPKMENFRKSLKRKLKNFKPSNIPIKFDIKLYQEKQLETDVICDSCGLDFSIYGVFSNCPDCGQLNAKIIFDRSIEVSLKKLLLYKNEGLDTSVRNDLPKDALNGCVSAFDALGKGLKTKYDKIIPSKPQNLFQNLDELNKFLCSEFGKSIADYTSGEEFNFIFKMFQVRHIYEHNAGVIDSNFTKKLPEYNNLMGRKYVLEEEEIKKCLLIIQKLGTQIFHEFE